jgi:hypothetical protein
MPGSAVYTTANTASVEQAIDRVISLFPNKFTTNINKNDIQVIYKDSEATNQKIVVRLVRGHEQALTGKKILMVVHKGSWVSDEEHERAFQLYEQLLRISWNAEKRKYVIAKPDLNTFKEIIQDFGVNGEKFREVLASKVV